MNEIFTTAGEVQEFCQQRHWKFCIIGGVAVHRWGEIRATNDVDITLLTGFGGEALFIDEWLKHYQLRSPCRDREFALRNRVLLLSNRRGTPVDIALGAFEFEERSIQRSTPWQARAGFFLRTCSAEDLLVYKCFANRDRDWVDVEGILARQWGKLNLELMRAELRPLAKLKEEPQILERLEQKIAHAGKPFTRITPSKTKKNSR